MHAVLGKLSLILNTITDGVLVVDTNGIVLYANQAAENQLERGSLIGKSLAIPVVQGETHQDINLIRRSGLAWTEMRSSSIEWEGQPAYAIGLRDITARKQAEIALKASEEKFSSIFRSSPDPILITTLADSTILDTNAGFERTTGYSAEECIGKTTLELNLWVHLEDRGRFIAQLQRDQQVNDFCISMRTKRGDIRTVNLSAKLIEWEIGQHIITVIRDITEQHLMELALHESEEKFRGIFEGARDGIVLIDSASGLIVNCNPEFERQSGRSLAQLRTTTVWDIRPAEEVAKAKQWFSSTLESGSGEAELSLQRPDGSILPIESRATVVTIGGVRYLQSITRDISERKQAEATLKAHAERLRQAGAVIENTHDGVILTDADTHILMVNKAFTDITGYAESDALGNRPHILSSGRHDKNYYAEMWANINTTGHWQGEIWNRRKNGEVYPELLSIASVKNEVGEVTNYVSVFADISKLKASEAKLEFLAHHDPLTQLPNRLLLLSRLEHGMEKAHRDEKKLALLMLDLDRFKDVNDIFGHLAGDELLQEIAQRLITRLRGVDTICRLGGDEFTVLLVEITHPEDAARVANDIIAALSQPCRLSNGSEVRVGVSVGISLFPDHGSSPEELLQHADTALYRAKTEGRGRFKYFSEDQTVAARERIELETRLRRAIECNELKVHFQPQINIATGRIMGAEALVRWQDPTYGMVPPSRFIRVAEETGLISAIGSWVLQETCRQGKCWIDAGLPAITLAVNLSSHQFLHSDINQIVATTLAETGFPANRLELELTESALMEREEEAIEILNRFHASGVRVAIDDFGTGYSSLAYLKLFPLDVLKIDKSFVDDIPRHRDDMEITATIIAMAHTLRLKVLAEGVETIAQLNFLKSQGCDYYQGYLNSPAVPAQELEKFLRNQMNAQTAIGT